MLPHSHVYPFFFILSCPSLNHSASHYHSHHHQFCICFPICLAIIGPTIINSILRRINNSSGSISPHDSCSKRGIRRAVIVYKSTILPLWGEKNWQPPRPGIPSEVTEPLGSLLLHPSQFLNLHLYFKKLSLFTLIDIRQSISDPGVSERRTTKSGSWLLTGCARDSEGRCQQGRKGGGSAERRLAKSGDSGNDVELWQDRWAMKLWSL